MVAVAGLVVGLRFFVRLYPARLLGKEDWCIFVAWIFSVANSIGMCLQVRAGLAEEFLTLTTYQQQTFFKWSYLTIIFYNTGLACVKVSILLLYLRILRDLNYRKACYVVLFFVVCVSLWTILSAIFFCVPIRKNWDDTVTGVCFKKGVAWYVNAGLNILTDFMILILPLPILPKIKQSRRQKIGLYLIFVLGFFICVVSILRIPSLTVAKRSSDPTRDSPGIAEWSIVELNTAIVCASLITLKPLATRFFPRMLGSRRDADRERDPGSEEIPATVGSKESPIGGPKHARMVSDGSTTQLNHETLGGDSILQTQHTESSRLSFEGTSDLEQGVKESAAEVDPAIRSDQA
ncbi:hypothetical protein CORC01_07593 [Colletotrichum orchidophilum]|uniref:Rhodopsin domain-containing protein n=1 Tax=Colletotrichum orchidophilum TaxID=1209926 RepID=A0A1G4B794_9PEZI|nr:uncharacterized protein CORC01_07593 [Colletotrichum orchidophilum]OHE97152.1 hypothetical protein CORC01_07593 [Colletotrichum orchidophilum]